MRWIKLSHKKLCVSFCAAYVFLIRLCKHNKSYTKMCLSTRNIENMKGKKKNDQNCNRQNFSEHFWVLQEETVSWRHNCGSAGRSHFFQDAEKVRLQWRSQLALEWKVGKLQRRRFTVGPEVQQNVEHRLKDCGKNFGFGRSPRCLILRPCWFHGLIHCWIWKK